MSAREAGLPAPINVLAVDADAATLAVVAEALEAPNCRLVTAGSGTEALRRIIKTDFALILLAVRLPELDGLEVATLIRQVRRSSHIPIIFLTPPDGPARPAFRGGAGGPVDYLAKPLDAAALQSLVAELAGACGRSPKAEMGRVGEDLESVIRDRTASLIRANDDLRREVARRERAEAALLAARLEAEAANSAKSEFLANMSHEIRTPMNGIVGLLELVLQTELSAEQREYLDLVKVSAGALLTIINDILDFSKIEAGSLELERTRFSLREVVGDTMKALAFEAARKGLEIACAVAPDVPDALLGDPVRLRQVVTNLVGNAIKFTASGEVVLAVRNVAGRDGEVHCEFAVRDTGIGIPGEKLKAIFAPFFQGDTSTTRVYGGTGLGLTIAARLVEIMGGTIGVDSAIGAGSVFRFGLRFGAAQDAPPARPDFRGLRVLAALHPVNREALLADLRHWQAEVVEAGSPDAAAALLGRGGRFDLVLLDDGLAGGDAGALAARLARGTAQPFAVAVLTSIVARPQRGRLAEGAGFAALAKPVKQSELLRLLDAAAGRGAPAGGAAPIEVAPPPRPALDVLLVEDNPINCRLAQQVLARAGHRVVTAENGGAALTALSLRRFDAVLMDVQMPGMDGLAATRLIRERERQDGGHVPVIALTAHAMVQHRERCLKAGMDGFLVKPIRPQDLLDALSGIERRKAARTVAARRPAALERAALIERTGADPGVLGEVAAMLGDKGRRLMTEARQALKARNAAQGARLMHTLAGMFGSLAASRAAGIAGTLERLAAARRWTAADAEFARLEREAERVGAELGAMAAEAAGEAAALCGAADEAVGAVAAAWNGARSNP